MAWWLGGKAIYRDGEQVAEVILQTGNYTIRNTRQNGTTGICFVAQDKSKVREWLDEHYPGWTQ